MATSDLRDQLQAALGASYTVERELGGGGMSRVFVATEIALGRRVVVKVLPLDLAAAVDVERFRREIQLAARLQHPNIVPIHAAGESHGIPYYTMPLVDGHSLRTRLANGGPVPITEAIGVLRDVAKALAYAHEHNVVHRDIKPDNVLLTGGTAVVTDFGVAKALSAAKSGTPDSGTLTEAGISLGTPAYMAPEQAAADPTTNHRADIYAFGVMAYETLAGRPPFHGRTPQKLLAAQMAERPEPIGDLRPDTPSLLAQLVMKCLEKDPDARPQSAADIVRVLETVTSGSGHPAMPVILLGGHHRLGRMLALYAAAFVGAAIVANAAIIAIGLPEWVFPGALIVMALGLPVILFTAFVYHTVHQAMTTSALRPGGSAVVHSTMTKLAVKASPWVSWRRTASGGAWALGAFAVLVAGYMVLRGLGIGPAGSLIGAGIIRERERLLVTDFAGPPDDSTLGGVVTEAIRVDLGQSPTVMVVEPTGVKDVLARMRVPGSSKLDLPLARAVAARDGIRVIVDGAIAAVGQTYVLSVRLVTTDSGTVLAAGHETAGDSKDLIPAIDRLAKRLRAKLGESLRSVRTTPPLADVTTASLAALRAYSAGDRAVEIDGDFGKAITQLEEAVALDTGFAMAYRKLAAVFLRTRQAAQRISAVEQAYAHRDRLTSVERNITTGSYYDWGPTFDARKSLDAYEAARAEAPDNSIAFDNAADMAEYLRDFERSDAYRQRILANDSATYLNFTGLAVAKVRRGDIAGGRGTIAAFASRLPDNPLLGLYQTEAASAVGQYDSAAIMLAAARQAHPEDLVVLSYTAHFRGLLAQLRGRLREAGRATRDLADADRQRGIAVTALVADLLTAWRQIWFLDQPERGAAMLDSAVRRHPLSALSPFDRPYGLVASMYAQAGRPDRARALLAAYDTVLAGRLPRGTAESRHTALGEIAIAEHRYVDAVDDFRRTDVGPCLICALPRIARAYDLAGNTDSAVAIYERYIRQPALERLVTDADYLAAVHQRLGKLYEVCGDAANAAAHYAHFIDLWKDADPELQPKVAATKHRLQILGQAERN